jgi:hypothetical protein
MGAIDGRSRVSKGLIAWKRELADSIGGQPSPQELMVIELACRNRMILDSIDSWLFQQKWLLNKKKKSVLPIVRERQAIDAALARHLQSLGLSRREPPAPTLEEHFRAKYAAQDETDAPEPPESQEPGIGSDEPHDAKSPDTTLPEETQQ